VIQIDTFNAYPSADRQVQLDVLAGRASKSYDNGHVQLGLGDDIPCSSSLCHYWSYFESTAMQGTASTLHFSDYQGQAHKIACSKGGQQGDAFETVFCSYSPCLAGCLHFMLLAPGPPFATMSSSLHHLQQVLLLLLSSNRYSSRILISTSMCPSSIASFRVIESTTTIMHVLFFKMLCRPILSSHVCLAWMQASPRRGCVSQGYPLAMMNRCSSLCRRRQLQSEPGRRG